MTSYMLQDYSDLPPEQMRARLLNSADFIRHLYMSARNHNHLTTRSTITQASNEELSVLLEILHRIALRQIRLYKMGSKRLGRSRRVSLLKRLASKSFFRKFLDCERNVVVTYLLKFTQLYNTLLQSLVIY